MEAAKGIAGYRGSRRRHSLRLLEDVGAIVTHASDLHASLRNIVETVAEHLGMEVCSLYVYDASKQSLILWATTGLDTGSVGRISMGVGEGLTGIVIQKLEPVMAIDAMAHPRYKYFPETGEERYHSFLGVPVVDQRQPLGVLIVQTSRRRRFTHEEVRLLKAVAIPIAGILTHSRLQARLETKEEERLAYQQRMVAAMDRLRDYETEVPHRPVPRAASHARLIGLGASPGFGIGRAHVMDSEVNIDDLPRERKHPLKRELHRFHTAVTRAVEELERTKERIRSTVPEIDAAMFDAQQLMLRDTSFLNRIEALIRDGLSGEAALQQTVNEFAAQFAGLEDTYLQDRAADIKDIGQRVLRHLLGIGERQRPFASGIVLVAGGVSLSDLALLQERDLKGVVLAKGGVTSHASILAKSLEIPTVVGAEYATDAIHEGDQLIVDGNAGVVYVNPRTEVLREFDRLEREYRAFNRELETLKDLSAETVDGQRVRLCANIGLLADMQLALLHGAEGIGLYRTEVPFLSHRDFLSEEEQVDLYRRVVEGMGGRPVTIRTLDLGADKYPAYLHIPREDNPFLGWRSIRISLELPDIFKTQLRAILRAAAAGPMRIMFPMISSLEELHRAKELLAEARAELQDADEPGPDEIAIGMMIEVPSAVFLIDHFVKEVDFISIGTNDLIQYVLAVDRNNRKVAPLYEPLHPAVIQMVAKAVRAAKAAGIPASICGEMAADPVCTPLLVGLGFDDLSMGPFFIPVIKRLIRSLTFETARSLADEVVNMSTTKAIKGRIFGAMRDLGMIDIMEMYH
ncbi:MAG: phosphoenolpyruvate--protein phosphotransferase [Candidatus Binatia bacterium]